MLIGAGSLLIVYLRLKNDFTPGTLEVLSQSIFSPAGLASLALCMLLTPVNWGLEAYKWQLITAPVEAVSYLRATKSIYAGLCLGNLAPGRATEFLAKILFFEPENRPRITVLHFVGGMFQLSVTVTAGILALLSMLHQLSAGAGWVPVTVVSVGLLFLLILSVSIRYIDRILRFISGRISRKNQVEAFHYRFSPGMLIRLFGLSVLRYCVFFSQFALLLFLFNGSLPGSLLPSIAVYFLVVTTIPMISVLEAAIRTFIALFVFQNSGVGETALALTALVIWLLNIIIPSLIGYLFLLKQNFNFNLFRRKA